MNTEGIEIGKTFFTESQIYQVGIREILSISLGGSLMRRQSSRLTRFIHNRTGIHRIPPLRSLSHVKRRGLRGSETAAKGDPSWPEKLLALRKIPNFLEKYPNRLRHFEPSQDHLEIPSFKGFAYSACKLGPWSWRPLFSLFRCAIYVNNSAQTWLFGDNWGNH